jgi:hypothetical protein
VGLLLWSTPSREPQADAAAIPILPGPAQPAAKDDRPQPKKPVFPPGKKDDQPRVDPPIQDDLPRIDPPKVDVLEQPELPKRLPWARFEPPAPLPIKPAPWVKLERLDADRLVRKLPGTVADVAVGGGGRFLVLHIPSQRQLAVFDVNEARVVKYLPVPEDNVAIAAGMDKLIVALPNARVLQRWSLTTFEREATAQQDFPGTVDSLTMGSASSGPLLVGLASRQEFGQTSGLFVDPATFKQIEPDWKDPNSRMPGMSSRTARASADGTVFAFRDNGPGEPHTMTVIALDGERAQVHSVWNLPGAVANPGPDGRFLYMLSGVYTTKLEFLYPKPQNNTIWKNFIPARTGGDYLMVEFDSRDFRRSERNPQDRDTGDVHFFLPNQDKPFARLEKISGLTGGFDRRIHFIPAAHLLVLAPAKGEQLILHRFDPEAALEKSGVDFLVITSQAPPRVKPGGDYVYPMVVKSKKGGVKYKLEAGPQGMAVDNTGKVTWKAPNKEGAALDVIISVGDASGQEQLHTFKVAVAADAPAGPPREGQRPDEPKEPAKPDRPPVKAVGAAVEPLEIKVCPIKGEQEECALPSAAREVTVGGGGRFVILSLPQEKKIAVFDVNEAKVVKNLPLAEDEALLAAGLDKLFVCLPRANVVQRWNLRTFEREAAAQSPVPGTLAEAHMGWASNGPLLLVAGGNGDIGGRSSAMFVDPMTLKELKLDPDEGVPQFGQLGTRFRPSGDGTVFARADNNSPLAYVVRDGHIKLHRGQGSTFLAAPGADGSFVCTMVGVYSRELQQLFPPGKTGDFITSPFIAAKQGRYFMRIGDGTLGGKKDFTFYTLGTERPLGTMKDFSGFDEQKMTYGDEALRLSSDRRYLLLPDARVLIALPLSNDRLILRKFDLEGMLDSSGIDYLLVTSRPPAFAKKGETFTYQLTAKAKKGEPKYRVEAGPKGMTIDAGGKLTWKVPAEGFDVDNDVLIAVSNGAGQEVFQSFRLQVAE